MSTGTDEAGEPADDVPGGDVVGGVVDDLVGGLVRAVVRPGDVDHVRASVERLAPADLAGLLAAVDDHQPMTLEVAVDVLAELGCPPQAIADAVAADVEDVQVLLGVDPTPPPSQVAADPRVIDLGGTHLTAAVEPALAPEAVDGDRPQQADDAGAAADRAVGRTDIVEPDDAATNGPADDRSGTEAGATDLVTGDARPGTGVDAGDLVTSVADPGEDPNLVVIGMRPAGGTDTPEPVDSSTSTVTGTSADPVPDGDAAAPDVPGPTTDGQAAPAGRRGSRPRVAWAVALFILLVGGAFWLAWTLGAW